MNGGAFLNTFFQRQGHWMVLANVATKVLGFAAVAYVTRHTTEQDFGVFSYAKNAVGALVPLMGFGAYQAFLRYSADAPSQRSKKSLYFYALGRGIVFSLALVAVLYGLAPWICNAIPDSVNVFRVLIWVIFSTLLMEGVKGYARAIHRNSISAKIDLTFAVLLVSATVALMQGMGILGYAIAVVIAPLLASIPFGMRMKLWKWEWNPLEKVYGGFWSYGLFTTLGMLLSQLFYAADVFLIGHHFGEEASVVAVYRVALIVPLASAVLPVSIAATDYMKNALNKHDERALRSYMVGYWKTFGALSLVLLGLLAWGAPVILKVFGEGYVEGVDVMRIFLIGSLGAHVLRVPYGHLLSAVGRADWNTYISVVLVGLTVVSCGWGIRQGGVKGAAMAMAAMYWLGGVMNAVMFEVYLRSLTRGAKHREQQEQI
ncbi:oligosaccharide flippase family protein [Flavobacteriales bacterium]|nr:oligosaccharide flippase family protein [Flavobacteriales bacterium]